ncbi:MAG: OsmC family protein [Deltaproteobacteria bacterium]|nr:OsmC family protein [Deltaproteobacteria bacterium]MBW1955923.1 OsmC family protein [Deltaproteobacteria bacterium]MBW2041304.1 OsmC family protein [Deltaproteobacteria bacterium]MBW2131778.1 OsmC family protein [Deltaproteobacteria bacterium]
MAAKTRVRWIEGKHFVGIDSTNHSVVLSGQSDGIGVKPSEMLLVALSACSSVDVVQILEKKRMALSFLEVTATAEQDPDPPWTFRKIHLVFRLAGKGLTPKAVEQAITLSQDKYCSVGVTLRGVAEITTEHRILPEENPAPG